MTYQANQRRIQNIFQMLFEMATGNFSHRTPLDEIDDQISSTAKVLNTMAENMRKLTNKSGYIIPVYRYQSLEQGSFILNKNFEIESFSNTITDLLGYKEEELYKTHFAKIIGQNSQDVLKHIFCDLNKEQNYFKLQQLSFKTISSGIVPHYCTFAKLLYSDKIIATVITTLLNDYIDYTTPTALAERSKNAALIQEVHNYILANLNTPLPNIKELAKLFGSNTYTLKDGFRYYFNTSIYHFYNEQRLKKAHDLLLQTSHPVKTIGFMTGFNDYPTFYKAFKKYFGYSPSKVVRKKETKMTDKH